MHHTYLRKLKITTDSDIILISSFFQYVACTVSVMCLVVINNSVRKYISLHGYINQYFDIIMRSEIKD